MAVVAGCRGLSRSLAADAWLIDPSSLSAGGWRLAQLVVTILVIGHILLAWYSGGRLRHFFWPLLAPFQLGAQVAFGGIIGPILRPSITRLSPKLAEDLYVERPLSAWFPPAILWAGFRRGRMYVEARDAVWDFVVALELPHYFWLGLRGFAGALAWLIVPSLMLIPARRAEEAATVLIGYVGALAMAFVLLYLAVSADALCRRESPGGNVRVVPRFADCFAGRPSPGCFALTVTLLFALPLYLLKIEPPPRELWWTLTIFFIVFIYPARLLTGWAVGRAMHHHKPRHLRVPLARAALGDSGDLVLSADLVLHAVHVVSGPGEPARAARVSPAGAVRGDVACAESAG